MYVDMMIDPEMYKIMTFEYHVALCFISYPSKNKMYFHCIKWTELLRHSSEALS